MIKQRSIENKNALQILFEKKLYGHCFSVLRQELDSFIRIIYLGRIGDFNERERLMKQTLLGEKWSVLTSKNKWKTITDKDMVDISNQLFGYVEYVYRFGCAFIHLSNSHNYTTINPFNTLSEIEQLDVKHYLNQYHGFSEDNDLTVENIADLIPNIFEKISGNMACYFDEILNNKMITN